MRNLIEHKLLLFIDWLETTSHLLLTWLFGTRRLIVVGDSHTRVFRRTKEYTVYHIGPATIFHLLSPISSNHSRDKFLKVLEKYRKGDKLLLVFGEIDCRIHIFHQYKKHGEQKALSYFIDASIERYGQVLSFLKERKIDPIVYNVVPAVIQENIYNYPHYGSRPVRAAIIIEFNEKLRMLCDNNNVPFIDISSYVADENGFIKPEFQSPDNAHLNDRVTPLLVDWAKYNL